MSTKTAAEEREEALAEWDRWYTSRPRWLTSEQGIKTEGIWWWIEKAKAQHEAGVSPEDEP